MLNTSRYFLEAKREQWFEPERILELQQKRLSDSLKEALKTPYYRKTSGYDIPSDSLAGFERLPLTHKEDVRSNRDEFISSGVNKEGLLRLETSGSTGKPLEIFIDTGHADLRTALSLLYMTETGLMPLDLLAIVRSWNAPPKPKVSPFLKVFRKLDLSILEKDEDNLEHMRRHKVKSALSNASVMMALARENFAARQPLRLDRVFTGSEVLSPAWRSEIEKSFGCRVFNLYGCWEFGPIAWECPEEHSLHVNSGSFFMEIVDDKGRPKDSGVGEIVLTSLRNHAMPLVRYAQGDLASWGKTCACGRGLPVLKSLEGRKDDMIILPSGKMRSPFSMNVSHIDSLVKSVLVYQIVQEKEDLFVFRYVPSRNGFSAQAKDEISQCITDACLGEEVLVEFEQVESIERRKGGKLDRVISKMGARKG